MGFSEQEQDILRRVSPTFNGKTYLIPAPQNSGYERLLHMFMFRNEINLYKNECAATGKELIGMYHPESPYKVIDHSIFWSDAFDAGIYARDLRFDQSFFDQLHQLRLAVPRMNLGSYELDNSPYVNFCGYVKNCYFTFNMGHSEDCLYSYAVWYNKDCVDCYQSHYLENCYMCIDSNKCYNCFYLQDCEDCADSYLLFDCRGCRNCIGCYGLRNKEYHINNKPVSKQEYEQRVQYLKSRSYHEMETLRAEFHQQLQSYAVRYLRGEKNSNVSGNYIYQSKNVERCFDVRESENCFDCVHMHQTKDASTCYDWGAPAELLYHCMEIGEGPHNLAFCLSCLKANSYLYYSEACINCKNCFGCNGLKNKEYCILNKQYTKEQYEELVPRIIAMMEQDKEWGQFFPIAHSPFAYNETLAHVIEPLTKEEIQQRGYFYRDPSWSTQLTFDTLTSDRIADVPENITRMTLQCEGTGRPYRIIPQEYAFYLKNSIPIPRKSFYQRIEDIFKLRASWQLVEATCEETGKPLLTAYAGRKVLSEEAYLEKL